MERRSEAVPPAGVQRNTTSEDKPSARDMLKQKQSRMSTERRRLRVAEDERQVRKTKVKKKQNHSMLVFAITKYGPAGYADPYLFFYLSADPGVHQLVSNRGGSADSQRQRARPTCGLRKHQSR